MLNMLDFKQVSDCDLVMISNAPTVILTIGWFHLDRDFKQIYNAY